MSDQGSRQDPLDVRQRGRRRAFSRSGTAGVRSRQAVSVTLDRATAEGMRTMTTRLKGEGPANLLPFASRVCQLETVQRLAEPTNDVLIAIREHLRECACAAQEQ